MNKIGELERIEVVRKLEEREKDRKERLKTN